MPKFDVIDEALVDAQPMVVYRAILDEYSGVTNWWKPTLEFKLRGNIPVNWEGAICDLTGHESGMTAKFCVKMTKIVEGKSIELEYSGDFIGTGKWTFEPMDGQTKASYQINIKTNKLVFSLIAPFMKNPAKPHSTMMQKGFKALNSYLSKK
jgi:hypothetical protein